MWVVLGPLGDELGDVLELDGRAEVGALRVLSTSYQRDSLGGPCTEAPSL